MKLFRYEVEISDQILPEQTYVFESAGVLILLIIGLYVGDGLSQTQEVFRLGAMPQKQDVIVADEVQIGF